MWKISSHSRAAFLENEYLFFKGAQVYLICSDQSWAAGKQ